MKILITGGSGFLGINLIRFLLKKNCQINSLDIVPFNYQEKTKINAVFGDVRDKKTVNELTKDKDIVIHAAAALPLYSKEDIFSTDVNGAKNVIEFSHKNKVKRLIYISSTAVYGVPDHHPVFETDKLVGVGPYGEAKIKTEKTCNKYRKQGLTVSIIRPKTFVGQERLGIFAMLYDWANTGHNFPIIGNGNNRYQLLDVQDLCEAIWLCITKNKNAVNDSFNIATNNFTTIKQDFQAVLDKAGFNKKVISLPAQPIIMALKILEFLKLSPLYAWIYETAGKDSYVSIKKAEQKLGFSPKYSNKQALLRNYKWYKKNLDSFKKENGISHRVPWNQGVLKLAKLLF